MLFSDTGLPWVPPSPNMPTPDTALVYAGKALVLLFFQFVVQFPSVLILELLPKVLVYWKGPMSVRGVERRYRSSSLGPLGWTSVNASG